MYYVHIRTYLAVFLYIRTIYVFHYPYIRTNTGIYVLYVYTYGHVNTYNNTNNDVHLYVQLWIRNFNTCKYVQDSLLMQF